MNQTLEDFLKSPRPKRRPDSTGMIRTIEYPKGKLIARCGEVFLFQTTKNYYAVVYGLQVDRHLARETACAEFGQCCVHQAECASLTIP